ncbi:MAG TPA: NAD-dependent epimerase/dehydratase family protein [Thermoleophilaceae bacterium]|nr:NAD-dependent epimerase/dehydratase family protein [Thermoleophilaceae bacterium]
MTDLADSRILVVGGAGFVGSNLVRALLERDPREVLVVDNLLSAERDNLPDDQRISFTEASINDDAVLAGLPDELDYVFHLSTYHGNQSSMADPLADHEHNTLTTLKLCEALKDKKALRKVVYASAGCTVAEKTFDGAAATLEDSPVSLWLDSPYQISKIIGELYFNYYFNRCGIPAVKARFQNVYGPGEVLGAGQWRGTVNTVWRNVTPTFVWKAMQGEALPVENGGIATRDLIYVEDMAEGLMACAERGGPGEIYNLASGEETSIRELAELINELTGNETPIALKPARDWDHSGQRYGSTDKAKRELGFEARTELRDGLERQIAWMRENQDRIERCIERHAERMAALEAPAVRA